MVDNIKIQTLKILGTLMATVFAFVVGLVWNRAIRALINEFLKAGSANYKFNYLCNNSYYNSCSSHINYWEKSKKTRNRS